MSTTPAGSSSGKSDCMNLLHAAGLDNEFIALTQEGRIESAQALNSKSFSNASTLAKPVALNSQRRLIGNLPSP
jgi:hypothetical protein